MNGEEEEKESDALNDVTLSFFEDALSALFQDSLFAHGNPGELIEFVRATNPLRPSPSIKSLVIRLPKVPDQSGSLISLSSLSLSESSSCHASNRSRFILSFVVGQSV